MPSPTFSFKSKSERHKEQSSSVRRALDTLTEGLGFKTVTTTTSVGVKSCLTHCIFDLAGVG